MTLNHLYKKLARLSNFENENNLIPFIETVEEIVLHKDPQSIPVIMQYFDDTTDYGWIMQSMIHALESFPIKTYIPTLIKCIPETLNHSPIWLEEIVSRIFNDHSYLVCFKKNIHLIPKISMIQLLDLVSLESEHHKDLCVELKKML